MQLLLYFVINMIRTAMHLNDKTYIYIFEFFNNK